MKRTLLVANLMLSAAFLAAAQKTPESMLGAALHQEEVQGDLKGAIAAYQKVVAVPGVSRKTAADALVRMGQCYEKLGDAESRKAYERVLREYSDQKEAATLARTRLGGELGQEKQSTLLANRRVWSAMDTNFLGAPSPNGRLISYSDPSGGLAIRNMETGESRVLLKREAFGAVFLSVFSLDGRKIAFASNKGASFSLNVVDCDGSNPRTLYTNGEVEAIRPAAWSPDGSRILATFLRKDNTSQIVWVSSANGTVTSVKSLDWRYPEQMSLSPDGRFIAYDLAANDHSPDHNIFLLAADGSREGALVRPGANDSVPMWTPDGTRVVFVSDRGGTPGLWSAAVSDGRTTGSPELVKADVGRIRPMGFTRSGNYYYGVFAGLEDIYIATLDRDSGKLVGQPAAAGERFWGTNVSPAWSPDGKNLAFLSNRGIDAFGTSRSIVVRSWPNGHERVIAPGLRYPYGIVWSPDSKALLVSGNGNAGGGYYRVDVETGGVAPVIRSQSLTVVPQFAIWSADGKAIYYIRVDKPAMQCDLRRIDLASGEEKVLLQPAKRGCINNLSLTPDGRGLLFGSSKSHIYQASKLMILPFQGGEPREILMVPDQPGELIKTVVWMPDGAHLLFSRSGKPSSELWRVGLEGGAPERVGVATNDVASLSVHPDGQHIAFTAGQSKREVWVLENFLPVINRSK